MKKSNKKLFRSLIKITFLCVIIACALALTSCDTSTTLHTCMFDGTPVKDEADASAGVIAESTFKAYAEEPLRADGSNKLSMFYLAADMTLDAPLAIPEGRFVGICTGVRTLKNLSYSVVDSNSDGTTEDGGVFTFSCGKHGGHGDRMYYYLDQNMVDLFGRSGVSLYQRVAKDNTTVNVALKTDINIEPSYTSLKIPSGYTVALCTNGYAFSDNVGIASGGGILREVDCKADYYHICPYLADDAYVVNQSNLQYLFSVLGSAQPGQTVCVYLSEDISWEGEISAPKGVTVMACLNGFSANGKVKNGGSSKFAEYSEPAGASGSDNQTGVESDIGDIFFYQCSTHICLDACDSGLMLGFNENSTAWNEIALKSLANPVSPETFYCLLEEDVEPHVIDGIDMKVCVNGYRDRVEQKGDNGSIYYYNCASSHDCAVTDLINSLVSSGSSGDDATTEQSDNYVFNSFLMASSVDDINEIFSELSSGFHCYSLTSDLIPSGTVYAPSDTLVSICTNGYSTEGVSFSENIVVYECGYVHCDDIDSEIVAFDQGAFDLFEIILSLMGFDALELGFDYTLALTEDIVLACNLNVLDGYTLTLCSCGHSITAIEGCAVTGNIDVHTECRVIPETSSEICPKCNQHAHGDECVCESVTEEHLCIVPEFMGILENYTFTATPLCANTVAEINSIISTANFENGDSPFYYLTDDIVGGGVISVPKELLACICLNGYSLGDAAIDTDGGMVFVYECREHYCTTLGASTYAVDQGVFDFFDALMNFEDSLTLSFDVVLGLLEDVTVREDMFVYSEDYDSRLYICDCGYEANGFGDDVVIVHTDEQQEQPQPPTSQCDHESWQALNYATFREITDKNGNVILPPGSYYYCLENDFQLPRTLTVTAGVDLHICLNGHMLYSPFVWFDSEMFGNGYPEAQSMSLANVTEGATFNIHDCSESKSGDMAIRFFRKNGSLLLTISENNTGFSALGEGLSAVLGTYMASIANNYGTINVYGGNLHAMTGFVNVGNGVINIYSGRINAGFAGVMQGGVTDESVIGDPQLYIGEDAVVSGTLVGVLGLFGDVELDGGIVNAGVAGLVSGFDVEGEGVSGDFSSVTVNGGCINLGNVANAQSVYTTIGLVNSDMQLTDVDQILGGDRDTYIAMATTGTVNLESDVKINAPATYTDDSLAVDVYMLGEKNTVNVSNGVESTYNMMVNGVVNVGDSENFVPIPGCTSTFNSEGDVVIIPTPSGDGYANISNMSVSTKGDIILNLYVTVYDQSILDKAEITVIYDGVEYTYPISDLPAETMADSSTAYRISVPIAAKDYKEDISYYFVLPDKYSYDNWAELVGIQVNNNTTSINAYLEYILENPESRVDIEAAQPIARAIQNYCASAAGYFGISDGYTVPDTMAEAMQSAAEYVTNVENGFKPTREGDYATSPAVLTGTTVILKTPFAVRAYFKMTDGSVLNTVKVDGYELTLDGDELVDDKGTVYRYFSTGFKDDPYCIEVSGIFAKDLSHKFIYDFGDWSFDYSVMSYAYSVLSSSKSSAAAKDTVKALIVYYQEALNYYNANHSPEGEEGGAE